MPGLDGLRAIAVLARHRLPPRRWLGRGRPARRRRLLHAQRLPDHRPAARPLVDARRDPAEGVLARPRAPPAAGAVPDADRGHSLGDGVRPVTSPPTSGRRASAAVALLQQLVAIFHDVSYFARFAPPCRWTTSGRSRSRSSSTSSGRSCCWRVWLVPECASRRSRPRLAPWCWPRRRLGWPMAVLYHPGSTPRASTTAPTRARSGCCSGGTGDGLAEPVAAPRTAPPVGVDVLDGRARRSAR